MKIKKSPGRVTRGVVIKETKNYLATKVSRCIIDEGSFRMKIIIGLFLKRQGDHESLIDFEFLLIRHSSQV